MATNDPKKVKIAQFDLVIVFHQSLARILPYQDLASFTGPERPFFAYFHLSPYEPIEAPGAFSQRLLADAVFANSQETKQSLFEYGLSEVEMFQNPAPEAYATVTEPSPDLERLLAVSSHRPVEVENALDILQRQGVRVLRVGKARNFRRVKPDALWEHDAVVTIGKTVQYGLRAGRPVYCYDHFQGPGWINRDFPSSEAKNFSGRCQKVPKSGEEIANEILDGYSEARTWSIDFARTLPERFKLEPQVDALLARVAKAKSSKRGTLSDLTDIAGRIQSESAVFQLVDRSYAKDTGVPNVIITDPHKPKKVFPEIKVCMLREPAQGVSKVIAAFSFRYDAHLVPDLLENIGPAIHGYVAWDDGKASEHDAFTDETRRQHALFEAAQAAGADWIFAVDPDERFEDNLVEKMQFLTNDYGPVVWSFDCRELFHPTKYRTDGIWNGRQRSRLFPCLPGMEPDQQEYHGIWTTNGLKLPVLKSGLSFYHLRMASPQRRKLRHSQYASLDPNRESQELGYDYLGDDRGMQLRDIDDERGYSPAFFEDGGMWSSSSKYDLGSLIPCDPPKVVIKRLQETWIKGGFENAANVAADLSAERPDDQELKLWAADAALKSGNWKLSIAMAKSVARNDRESLMARMILARAYWENGNAFRAKSALSQAERLAKGSWYLRQIKESMRPLRSKLSAADAGWRRWIDGAATIHEGTDVVDSPICAVVISRNAPPELYNSIESLLRGTVVPEITVVNSNGGDIFARLAPFADRVRIINTETRLYPGAARNAGIDASNAAFVSFLASDCIAGNRSIEKRLNLHIRGAKAVSGYVSPKDSDSITQNTASFLLHPNRHPNAKVKGNGGYSLSYHRSLFENFGYFPSNIRIGEDTSLNQRISRYTEIESDPEICIRHAYPDDTDSLAEDIRNRARRRVSSYFFPPVRSQQELQSILITAYEDRLALSLRELGMRRDEFSKTEFDTIKSNLVEMLQLERQESYAVGQSVVRAWQLHDLAKAEPNRPEFATTMFHQAVDILPEYPVLKQALANHLRNQSSAGPLQEPQNLLDAAVSLDPVNANILMNLMEVLLGTGDTQSATARFETASLMAPSHKEIWARHAPLPGDEYRPMRVYSLQRMFFLDPFDASTSRTLSENYEHAGNFAARDARRTFLADVLS